MDSCPDTDIDPIIVATGFLNISIFLFCFFHFQFYISFRQVLITRKDVFIISRNRQRLLQSHQD